MCALLSLETLQAGAVKGLKGNKTKDATPWPGPINRNEIIYICKHSSSPLEL